MALAAPAPLAAQSRQERRDYLFGSNLFSRLQYKPAELAFTKFLDDYTNSVYRTNAILYLAQSRINLSNYPGALELLKREMPPGQPAPDFVYWMARAYYGMGDYSNAIARCASLLQNPAAHPPLPLRAILLQARALDKLTNWPAVTNLLSKPDGVFQSATHGGQSDAETVAGYFLLGSAYYKQAHYALAEAVLGQINTNSLSPDWKWQRQDLLCLVWLEEERLEEALEGSANLLPTDQDQRIATAFLRGEILERTNRLDEAIQAYSANLENGIPLEARRQAWRKTMELKLLQNQPSNTMSWLETNLLQWTNQPFLDLARFHLGDLKLKAYFALPESGANGPPAAATNLLQSAISNLDLAVSFPKSELLGRACLDRGWCDWAQGKFTNAAANFSAAATHLPFSENRAVALLKLGDACFQLGDYTNAVFHYHTLTNDFAAMPNVTNQLFDLALYQLVQANVRLGQEEAASNAAQRLLAWFPISGYGEQSLLLLGEDSSNRKTYAAARKTFQELLDKFPGTPLWPQVQLAIARTYEQEGDWTHAFNTYSNLEGNPDFASNALRPEAAFALALACGKAGQESGALVRMSNVVIEFPADTNAALAQNWIGNYHMNHGNYEAADYAFQQLANPKNFPSAGVLAWEARLMAGQAAAKHLDLAGAINDFHLLSIDTNAPAEFVAQATFQLGYTAFQQCQRDPTNANNATLLKTAINALSSLTNSAPANSMGTLAFGQLGSCYLALADQDKSNTNAYTKAIQMFQSALQDTHDSPVDVTARSQARFGLGLIAERQNQTNEALFHYCEVLFDVDSTQADPAFVKDAGVKAAALYEEQKDWPNAVRVYQRVAEVVPSLRSEMQKHIDAIKAAAN